jgi:hypothetical protein
MWKMVVAILMSFALPLELSAGSLREAGERAARELATAQREELPDRGRGARFWTGVTLIAGGGVLATMGALEVGDDEPGPDDGEDEDASDDGEDSDGWNKALLGGGIAAAGLGSVLLLTGRKSGPVVSARAGRVIVRHTVRF